MESLPDPSGAEPIRETYLYCRPRVLDTEAGESRVDCLLLRLALELGLPGPLSRLGTRGSSIAIAGEPGDVWRALERVSTYWTQRELFLIPGTYGPWREEP